MRECRTRAAEVAAEFDEASDQLSPALRCVELKLIDFNVAVRPCRIAFGLLSPKVYRRSVAKIAKFLE